MKRTIGSFTRSELEEFANKPGVVVYEPSHTMHFAPWKSEEIDDYITKIIERTRAWSGTADDLRKDLTNQKDMCEFAARYKTFFEKLTDKNFATDEKHVEVMRKIVHIRAKVDTGEMTEEAAKIKCADIALESLVKRAT